MPNWCHNTFLVSGDEPEVMRWTQIVRQPGKGENSDGTPLFFSSILPEPSDIGDGWYEWRVDNWGTKWEPSFAEAISFADPEKAGHPGISRQEGSAEYSFDTAWGPPLEWIEQASKLFPQLRFSIVYGEPGMGVGGKAVFIGGEVVTGEMGAAEQYLDEDMMWF